VRGLGQPGQSTSSSIAPPARASCGRSPQQSRVVERRDHRRDDGKRPLPDRRPERRRRAPERMAVSHSGAKPFRRRNRPPQGWRPDPRRARQHPSRRDEGECRRPFVCLLRGPLPRSSETPAERDPQRARASSRAGRRPVL